MFQSARFEDKQQWERAANEDLLKDQISFKKKKKADTLSKVL